MVRKIEVPQFANFVGTGPSAQKTLSAEQLSARSAAQVSSRRLNRLLKSGASFEVEGREHIPAPPPGESAGGHGRPDLEERRQRTAQLADTLPKATGRFALARHLNGGGRPSSAAVRRRVAGNPPPRVTKKEPFEPRGVAFESSATRFRRSIFPEHDQTQLQSLEWANNTHLETGIYEPDIKHAENGPRYHMVVAAQRSAREYKIMSSKAPRLILDKVLKAGGTSEDIGPGKYNPKSTILEPVKSTVSSMRSVVPRMVKQYEPAGDANMTLPNYEHSWDTEDWVSHTRGKQTGTVISDATRLEPPELAVSRRGEMAGAGERGWGVPERNIPSVNIGVKPMSDVTPDHKYDINDPFGEWTMSQELIKSPREYRAVFKSQEPRFMQPIERTAAVIEKEGRELAPCTYGSSWYKIPHVARDVQAPFLGPRGTGGSELLKIREEARGRVQDVLRSCEDKARIERMKEAAAARQASWLAAKKSANPPHSARF